MENDKVTRESLVSEVAHKAEDRLEDSTQAYLAKPASAWTLVKS